VPEERRNAPRSWKAFVILAVFIVIGGLMRSDLVGAPMWVGLVFAGLLIGLMLWKA
jgi:hypothetical protein